MNNTIESLTGRDTLETDMILKWENLYRPYKKNTNAYVENQKKFESNARTYPRNFEIAIARAEGIYIEDTLGNIYLDCLSGAGALALGHNHPVIIKAIQKSIDDKLPLLTLDLTTPTKDKFIHTLLSILPNGIKDTCKIQFCSPCGTDAVEAALKLVKTATGRKGIFSFTGAYHGMTHGTLGLMGNNNPKKAIPNLMKDVTFLPFPYHYRCPFGIGGREAEDISLNYIKSILEDSHSGVEKPAAFILETIQGEGGSIPASDYWIQGIRALTFEYDIPLIIDEIQSGIGRTGNMFSFESSGIVPDVIVISKAIGGSLPLSMIVYQEKLDNWLPGAHAGTFRGNQLAMATGQAVLEFIINNNLLENVREKNKFFLGEFEKLKSNYPFIGEVRGKGLMIGLEIVDTSVRPNILGSYPPNPNLAKKIQEDCFINGLIIETGGRKDCVLRLLPPLNISDYEAEQVIKIIKKVFINISQNN